MGLPAPCGHTDTVPGRYSLPLGGEQHVLQQTRKENQPKSGEEFFQLHVLRGFALGSETIHGS